MSKRATLLLIAVLTVSSLLMVKAAPASVSTPKQSVPEFTVKLIDSSYNVPATTTIEPYTGPEGEHSSTEGLRLTAQLVV
jgi:hypothetical protein